VHPSIGCGRAMYLESRRRPAWTRSLVVGSTCLLAVAALVAALRSADRPIDDWPAYGHDAGSMRHSPLTDITRGNVSRLAVPWTFHTDDMSDGRSLPRSGFETTPIAVTP